MVDDDRPATRHQCASVLSPESPLRADTDVSRAAFPHTGQVERGGQGGLWWLAAGVCGTASVAGLVADLAQGSTASALLSGLDGFSCAIAVGYSVIAAALRVRDPHNRFAVVLLLAAASRAMFVLSRAWSLDGAPLFGISVFAVVDQPLEALLRERLRVSGRCT